jgi:hypothetical protein
MLPARMELALLAMVLAPVPLGQTAIPREMPSPAPQVGIAAEAQFVASLGVNIHANYNDGAYANLPLMVRDLRYLGIVHVRTAAPGGVVPLRAYLPLAGWGLRFDFLLNGPDRIAEAVDAAGLMSRWQRGSVTAVEGLNEVNNLPVQRPGLDRDGAARAVQRELYQAVKANRNLATVPVYHFTGGPAESDLDGMADYANVHAYNNNATQPGPWLVLALAQYHGRAATMPRVLTEFGNFTLPPGWPDGKPYWAGYTELGVDEPTQARIILTGFCEAFLAGYVRSYVYELLDEKPDPDRREPQFHFGLFDFAHRPKAAARALHNLTTFLRVTTARETPGASVVNVEGTPAPTSLGRLVLRRADGSAIVLLWSRAQFWRWDQHSSTPVANAPVAARITGQVGGLGDGTVRAVLLDPLTGAQSPVPAQPDRSFTVMVPDYPVLVWLAPESGAHGPPATVAPLSPKPDGQTGAISAGGASPAP